MNKRRMIGFIAWIVFCLAVLFFFAFYTIKKGIESKQIKDVVIFLINRGGLK